MTGLKILIIFIFCETP